MKKEIYFIKFLRVISKISFFIILYAIVSILFRIIICVGNNCDNTDYYRGMKQNSYKITRCVQNFVKLTNKLPKNFIELNKTLNKENSFYCNEIIEKYKIIQLDKLLNDSDKILDINFKSYLGYYVIKNEKNLVIYVYSSNRDGYLIREYSYFLGIPYSSKLKYVKNETLLEDI